MAICEIHGEYESQHLDFHGMHFEVGCPECDRIRDEKENQRRIQKEKSLILQEQDDFYRTINIEPAYKNASLDSFKVLNEEHRKALGYAQKMVDTREGKLVLLGPNGTGKTHLAIGVLRIIGGKIQTMYEITTRIRSSYSGHGGSELEIVDELASIPLLVIDEIGRTKGSDAELNWLSYIIDKRHVRNLPLILISNKHSRKSCKEGGCQNCIENYLSEDVISRISQDGYLVNFPEGDYRRTLRAKT